MSRREFTKQVKRDAFLRAKGCCEGTDCGIKIKIGGARYDHIIPDALGGEPTLDNCQVLCEPCHKIKTGKRDVPTIAKTKRIQDREMGIRKPSRLQSRGFTPAPPQNRASKPLQKWAP
jgi:5-methylcytosine-specific restriction protein A